MAEQNPIPYYASGSDDLSHLRALAICHYVWGSLAALFSCFFIIHIVMGIWLAHGGPANANWTTSGPAGMSQGPPPAAFGYLMAAAGGCGVIFGWTYGILTIISGRKITRFQSRIFSIVIAGINCISVPFGTVLGIFTIVVLSRDSVKKLYDEAASRPVI